MEAYKDILREDNYLTDATLGMKEVAYKNITFRVNDACEVVECDGWDALACYANANHGKLSARLNDAHTRVIYEYGIAR